MYCPQCGEAIADGSRFCSKCGAPTVIQHVPVQQVSIPQYVTATSRTSGMAVASLVLGIISLLLNPLAILAIIFGGVALSQTSHNPTLGGRGMAIAGLVLGIIVVVFWIVMLIWFGSFFWWFSNNVNQGYYY
jgi:hypothetical protein